MKVTVFIPEEISLTKRDLARWANVPVFFDAQRRYMRIPSRYMRARATREYSPKGEQGDYPRPETLRTIAYRLAHFFNWAATNGTDWLTVQYETVLAYQNERLVSRNAQNGKCVQPKTANKRADEVVHLLHWASLNGFRPIFQFDTKIKERWIGGRLRQIRVRLGRAREPRGTIEPTYFPTAQQIKTWLRSVRDSRGEAKWLVCRFVMETGVRLSEASQLKLEDWPSEASINKAIAANSAFVHMMLRHGTKGGVPRQIRVPVDYALQIRLWLRRRNTYVYRHFQRTGMRTDRLFVSDAGMHAGTPLSNMTIWRCFREVSPRPDGWTTHTGRHAYAVFFVLYALEREAAAAGAPLAKMNVSWIHDRGRHWLMILRKQFGHASEETTLIYLRWLMTTIAISDYASSWHLFLNSEDAL